MGIDVCNSAFRAWVKKSIGFKVPKRFFGDSGCLVGKWGHGKTMKATVELNASAFKCAAGNGSQRRLWVKGLARDDSAPS